MPDTYGSETADPMANWIRENETFTLSGGSGRQVSPYKVRIWESSRIQGVSYGPVRGIKPDMLLRSLEVCLSTKTGGLI